MATTLAPPSLPRIYERPEDTIQTKVAILESDMRALRGTLERWTIALVVCMLGAAGTAGGALVAYGRLQERADNTAAMVQDIRGDIADLRSDLRHDRDTYTGAR